MTSKAKLLSRIVGELLAGQRPEPAATAFEPEFPFDMAPRLPVGDGRWLPFSRAGLSDVNAFAQVLAANNLQLATSFSRSEVSKIVGRAFGISFASIELDADRGEIEAQVDERVHAELAAAFGSVPPLRELALGCRALTGEGTEDLKIGPVRITQRNLWLDRMEENGRVSHVASRRIRAAWCGKKLRPQKRSLDDSWEVDILESIGDCDTVCAVSTVGLGPKVAEQKGLLAARMALTTLALFWRTPSKALERMGLLYDGPLYRRHWISFSETAPISSGREKCGIKGHFVTDEWRNNWKTGDWLLFPIGEALTAYIHASTNTPRPNINRALLQALWWFRAACIEQSQLLSVVKFTACLDALAAGNQEAGICQLLEARLGMSSNDNLTKSGKTIKQVVAEMYKARSLTIHGTNRLFGHDWADTRALAESVAATCFRVCCDWVHSNPSCDDLAKLRK